jgi:membrane protein DedA with SNARE-associated domain
MTADLLAHGSLLLAFAWLVVGGIGLPVPEDAALLSLGVLVFHGAVAPVVALAIALIGVLAGDVGLFLLARRLGTAAYERPMLRRFLTPARRVKFEAAYRRHGGRIVFMARQLVGIRAATFALAGIHGMPLRKFIAWDALAACLSVPLVLGLGYVGALHIDRVQRGIGTFEHYAFLVLAAVVLGYLVIHELRRRKRLEPCTAA